MEKLTIETRTGKESGNDYKFISGDATYYLSALKRAMGNNQTETMEVPGELAEFTKHLLYNRVLKGFICSLEKWNVVEEGLNALTIPENYLDQVKKILPKAAIFGPANSSTKKPKATNKDTSIIDMLVEKLQKYDNWSIVPKESITKINAACEEHGVKIAQIRKAYEATKQPKAIQDMEL